MKRGAIFPEHSTRNVMKALLLNGREPSKVAQRRKNLLDIWREMRRNGVSVAKATNVVGVPRSTLYDWEKHFKKTGSYEPLSRRLRQSKWSPELEEAVRYWREYSNGCWGKDKIVVKLREDDFDVSTSTVGRILADLIKRGKLQPRLKKKLHRRKNQSRPYGEALPKGLLPNEPGAILQLDTAYITLPGTGERVKHIAASDPVSKWFVFRVYKGANSKNASDFLRYLVENTPFPIQAIQVDRGSEFRGAFEQACKELGIKLYVLPVKRPDLNGSVERSHRTCREEFYQPEHLPLSLEGINERAEVCAWKFNHEPPHRALDCRTPADNLRSQYGLKIPESSGMLY